jgi:hypothetical protein
LKGYKPEVTNPQHTKVEIRLWYEFIFLYSLYCSFIFVFFTIHDVYSIWTKKIKIHKH